MAATDLERLVVQLSADIKGYQKSLDRAVGITNNAAGRIQSTTNKMHQSNTAAAQRSAAAQTRAAQQAAAAQVRAAQQAAAAQVRAAQQAAAAQQRFFATGRNALAGLGLTLGVKEIQEYADVWTQAGNKIASASQVAGLGARSLEEINKIAQRSRSGFEATVVLYSRILQATRGVVKNEGEVARITETVSKAFQAGGANAQEAAGAVIQLAQALGSGTLQGDELRSLRENAPLLAQAIAREFGVTVGELKKLGSDGELTTERVVNAIINGTNSIEAAFATTRPTIANGFKAVENSFIELLGTFDKSAGVTASLSQQLSGLSKILDGLADSTGEALKQWDEFLKSDSLFAKLINIQGSNNPLLNLGRNFSRKIEEGRNPFDRQFLLGGEDTGAPTAEQRKALEEQIAALEEQRDKLVTLTDQQRQNGIIVGGNVVEIQRLTEALEELRRKLLQLPAAIDSSLNPSESIFRTDRAFQRAGSGSTKAPDADSSKSIQALMDKGLSLLEIIAKKESGNVPGAVNYMAKGFGGAPNTIDIYNMTFRQLFAQQREWLAEQRRRGLSDKERSSAVGIYQIIRESFERGAKTLGIDLDKRITPAAEKAIAQVLLKETGGKPQTIRDVFQGVKGATDEQLTQMYAQSRDDIVEANEALDEQKRIWAEILATGKGRIADQEFENKLLGDTSLEAEKLRAQYEAINAAKEKLNRELTPQEREQIIQQADLLAEQTYQTKQLEEAQKSAADAMEAQLQRQDEAAKQLQDTMNQIGQAFGSAFQGFISDLVNGKKLTEALRDALLKLGESLLNIALNNLTSSLTSGGGLLGGLFGGATQGGGGGGLLGGLFHGGGEVGKSGGITPIHASEFTGAKRYHSGRLPGLRNDEMASILKKNELVIPSWDHLSNMMRNIRNAGGGGRDGGLVQNNTFIAPDMKSSLRSQNQLARTAGSELSRFNRTL